jgi:hypothetical protein
MMQNWKLIGGHLYTNGSNVDRTSYTVCRCPHCKLAGFDNRNSMTGQEPHCTVTCPHMELAEISGKQYIILHCGIQDSNNGQAVVTEKHKLESIE